ncbi:anaerobic carbon-monoxide dehydrogenase catalytic subunit [Calderihabitans maritimus]|uniref:Carbon monoxide dehydrogenase n=1 Tax=Calderihabitans maritimus TaxID=1246530 RepID=A0A1Z5HWJ0_9FIRM|nr:anaerobic carbon-monoxide dehydrogenase catalytic subunit [Calderihabitans maritimus]GAW93685.1 carbon-monoxide dehydrogenase, catalytic subunit [Calderihabitans maritimus]
MKYLYPLLNAEMPGREDVLELTPNRASKEMLEHLAEQGVETFLDRFEAQQPQCGFGLRGLCCRMCQWGPCRISEKAPRGICGRDLNLVVMSNIVRALVAGLAAHGRHAHEVILTIIEAAEGRANFKLKGEQRVWELAEKFQLDTQGKDLSAVAKEVAFCLLEDLGRMTAGPMYMLEAYAPQERKQIWKRLGVLPRSASYEVMETLHMTTLGGCSDWTALAEQELRSALAYCYSTLFGSSMATEILFGIPKPKITQVNYGVLKEDHVNILVHGHSPVMVEKILEKINSPEIQELARTVGAKGIVVGGMCCTGDELLARYGIPTVTNIMGQELALGTGAVDAVVVDMQCVIPGLKIVADCFGTEVITTCNSNRIPGATHIPFDAENPANLDEDALKVARIAVESFAKRDRSKIRIPQVTTKAMAGWSYEAIKDVFGGTGEILRLLREGTIKGIVTVVGCNTPKVPYEYNHVTIVRKLIESGILVTTTGCCSHALLNAGLCAPEAAEYASSSLKELCQQLGIPPVLAVGGCVDNTRTLRLFIDLAEEAGVSLADMPFMFVGPEPGNEKTVGQGVSFLAHGVSNLVGFPAPIPVPVPKLKENAETHDDLDPGINDIVDFFGGEGLYEKVGAKVFTEPYPKLAAQTIRMHIRRKRLALGWK